VSANSWWTVDVGGGGHLNEKVIHLDFGLNTIMKKL